MAAGFFVAAQGNINFWLLLLTLVGVALSIASACVLNNYIDRGLDKRMARTKKRALAAEQIPALNALIYSAALGIAGLLILCIYVNLLTAAVGVVGFVSYVGLYSYFKRRSVHGTLVGTISGATPPVSGYVAVTNQLDSAALILFLILVVWQMPHFYAIALFRLKDYAAANLPVRPVSISVESTKKQILFYITLFVITAPLLTVFGYTSWIYGVIALGLGLSWLGKGLKTYSIESSTAWGKQMFLHSLLVLLILCAAMSLDATFI